MLESAIVKRIRKVVEARGGFIVKNHPSFASESGLPDFFICYRGLFIGLEVKRPGNEPTDLQKWQLSRIKAAGGIARTATTVEEANYVLDAADDTFARLRVPGDGGAAGEDSPDAPPAR